MRTAPAWGAGASGTSVLWSCSSPPLAVRTQARTRPAYGRKVGVIICSVPVVGIGIGVPDPTGWMYTLYVGLRRFCGSAFTTSATRSPEGDTAHDLLDRTVTVAAFDEVGERAVAQETGVGFLLLRRARELPLVRAVAAHQPDVVILVPH